MRMAGRGKGQSTAGRGGGQPPQEELPSRLDLPAKPLIAGLDRLHGSLHLAPLKTE